MRNVQGAGVFAAHSFTLSEFGHGDVLQGALFTYGVVILDNIQEEQIQASLVEMAETAAMFPSFAFTHSSAILDRREAAQVMAALDSLVQRSRGRPT
jgi:hypothetical protein